MLSPMPTCTDNSGPSMPPATAHSAAPRPNTSVNRRRTFTPMASAISRFDAPARTCMPTRVQTIFAEQQRHSQAHTNDEQTKSGIGETGQQLTGPARASGGFSITG